MGRLEDHRLARKCPFFFSLLRTVVRYREAQTCRRAYGLLVAEPRGLFVIAQLRPFLQERFGIHLRLCIHLDTLHPQFGYPAPA